MAHYQRQNSRGVAEISIVEKFWQFIRFTVVTGMVFVVSFFALNFNAYRQIFTGVFNPEVQANVSRRQDNAKAAANIGRDDAHILLRNSEMLGEGLLHLKWRLVGVDDGQRAVTRVEVGNQTG